MLKRYRIQKSKIKEVGGDVSDHNGLWCKSVDVASSEKKLDEACTMLADANVEIMELKLNSAGIRPTHSGTYTPPEGTVIECMGSAGDLFIRYSGGSRITGEDDGPLKIGTQRTSCDNRVITNGWTTQWRFPGEKGWRS